ncbi:MAG: hypothetical protein WCK17_11945, partial [Verrucomicrobiota bacterium]
AKHLHGSASPRITYCQGLDADITLPNIADFQPPKSLKIESTPVAANSTPHPKCDLLPSRISRKLSLSPVQFGFSMPAWS